MRKGILLLAALAAFAGAAEARCRIDGPPASPAERAGARPAEELATVDADWLRIGMATAAIAQLDAPAASRLYAFLSIDLHDAHALATGRRPYAVSLRAPSQFDGTDALYVMHASAAALLTKIRPELAGYYAAKLAELVPSTDSKSHERARAFGEAVARTVFERCYYAIQQYDFTNATTGARPGKWRPTYPSYKPPLESGWPGHEPLELERIERFIPHGPPDLVSEEYAQALTEVKTYGRFGPGARTADQTAIARFWRDDALTCTPPGHWLAIALQETAQLPLSNRLKILLAVNISMSDAGLAAWEAKYRYRSWRPIDAIRQAGDDGNPMTTPEESWRPLLATPSHPEYVSGHSTFSAAAATVLTHYLGERAFSIGTESPPRAVRRYASFRAAAEEAGMSRIYGGIHFSFSNRDGQELGRRVAEDVIARIEARLGISEKDARAAALE